VKARRATANDACARPKIQVDVLVNNAAVYLRGTTLGASSRALRESLETNFMGALWTCRAFVPGMIHRGYGRVVNVSTDYGSFGRDSRGPPRTPSRRWR